ncbi:MAG: rhodanese-like domain-containing protein [Gemmatimonadota bacterium]
MTRRWLLSLCLSLALAAAMACGGGGEEEAAGPEGPDTLPASVPAPAIEAGLLIVTPDEVRGWQDAGAAFVLVDARDQIQYAQEHLPGAINIPYVEIRAGGALPPRDARVVVYCSDEQCPISQYAYQALDRLGYVEVYDLRAGLQGWKEAGHPTVLAGESPPTAEPDGL